jgi:PAS domain S-box-containing protein
MVLSQKITAQIKDVLRKNPQGLSITGIVNAVKINRNTAGRYLESLLVSGQVEMRHFGMAKIYTLSHRVPLSAVLSISSELILQLDSDLRIVYANEPLVSFLGTTQKELFGKNIQYSVMVPVLDDLFEPFMKQVQDGLDGMEWNGELTFRQQEIIFACRIAPTAFDNGQKGVSVILEDITGRKKGEERVRKSEELYRSLAETAQDLIFVINAQDRVEYVNSYAAAVIGKTGNEIVNMERSAIFPPEINQRQQEFLHHVFMTGEPSHDVSPLVFQGTMRWFDHFLVPLKSPDGSIRAVLGVSRDITERKLAETALGESERKYRGILENTYDAYFRADLNGRITMTNPSAARIFGFTSVDEMIGIPVISLYNNPEHRQEILTILKEQGVIKDFISEGLRKDGTTLWVSMSVQYSYDTLGNVTGTEGFIRDITNRKLAEDALKESQQQLEHALQGADEGLIDWDVSRGTLTTNDTSACILGYSLKDFPTKVSDLLSLVHPDDRVEGDRRFREHLEGKTPLFEYEERIRNASGKYQWILARGKVVARDDKGLPVRFLGTHVDITKRKQVEESLRESEDRFRRIFDDGPLGMAILSKEYRFVMVNQKFCEMLGFTAEELLAKTFVDVTDTAHVDQDLDEVKNLYTGRIPIYRTEKRYIRKDGTVIWGSLTVSPLKDNDGHIVSTIAIVEDVTARKHSEK